ncbi:MAG: FecR family protein [Chitinophagaceae bacterium]|nr:FecR family protein [Chitinophagaceae bacterium]
MSLASVGFDKAISHNCLLQQMNNRVAYLISKRLSAEISENESRELNDWLANDPSLFETINLLEIAWKNQDVSFERDEARVKKLMERLRLGEYGIHAGNDLPEQGRKPLILSLKWWAAAAAVLAVLAFSFWKIADFSLKSEEKVMVKKGQEQNQVATRPGNRTHIELKDGTRVWLNADSKLTYKDFDNNATREVSLEGEAFFEIESNPDRPFIIKTEKARIKVTGTTLNVRDYPGERKAETSLLSGKAEVYEAEAPDKVYYLKPNEKVVFTEKSSGADILLP